MEKVDSIPFNIWSIQPRLLPSQCTVTTRLHRQSCWRVLLSDALLPRNPNLWSSKPLKIWKFNIAYMTQISLIQNAILQSILYLYKFSLGLCIIHSYWDIIESILNSIFKTLIQILDFNTSRRQGFTDVRHIFQFCKLLSGLIISLESLHCSFQNSSSVSLTPSQSPKLLPSLWNSSPASGPLNLLSSL